MKTKIALIPAYEPENNFIDLIKKLSTTDFEIVVVDDGSGEKYKNIFDKISKHAKVISYPINHGKGYALKIGLNYIKDNYSSYIVVTMDCDGQHSVKDAIKLSDRCLKYDNTLFLGKRVRSKKTPIRSRIGNSITRFIYKITTGLDVYDTQTGLRAFSDKLMDLLINIDGDRYEYEMNVLLVCSKQKIKIKEVEIETIYIDNNSNSHFDTIKDSILVYKEIIKFSLSSLISFIIDYLLYTLFIILSNNLILSNIIARIISAIFNYVVNRNIVFENKRKISKSIIEYFSLAILILIINTLILDLLVNKLFINAILAKLLVEITLFIISYIVQHKFIFKKN